MKSFILPILLFLGLSLSAQIGGEKVYEFLNLAPSARITALGDNLITVRDDDVALAYANPAALHSSMHQQLSFNYNFHLAGISNGYAAFGQHIEKWNTTLHAGIQFINYGSFDTRDAQGNIIGDFKAAEYALNVGAGRTLYERLSVGANLKLVTSQFESYKSFGIVSDWSAMFHDTTRNLNATLLFKNVGGQLTTYRSDNREAIPFEIQLGMSKRLKHLPLRFSIIAHNLQQWNILYDDPNQVEATFLGDVVVGRSSFDVWTDNFFRHFIFNGEFLFGKKDNFRVRVGYNHLRRAELKVEDLRSLSGFSFGLGMKIKRFRIDYGRGLYHLAGALNHFSISTSFSEFR